MESKIGLQLSDGIRPENKDRNYFFVKWNPKFVRLCPDSIRHKNWHWSILTSGRNFSDYYTYKDHFDLYTQHAIFLRYRIALYALILN